MPGPKGGRPKGYPKSGGRVKGTPNKFCRSRFIATLEAAGIDPTEKLIELLPRLPPTHQAGIYIDWQRELLKEKPIAGEQAPPAQNPADKEPVDALIQALRATNEANQARAITRTKA